MLQKAWHLPFRKLVLAMPLTAAIVALGRARAHRPRLDGVLPARRAAGADRPGPVVIGGHQPARPRVVRHSLNLESGMNDGLALPAVLAFTAALVGATAARSSSGGVRAPGRHARVRVRAGMGLRVGAMPRERRVDRGIPDHQKSLYALGAAFATYGVAVGLPPEGNGLIAVFVCAIVLGIRRPDLRETFEARRRHRRDRQARRVRRVRLAAHARRPVRRRLGRRRARRRRCSSRAPWRSGSRWRTGCRPAAGVHAWFGPKGVATMTFSLLVLSSGSRATRGSSTSPRCASSSRSSRTG